jgi:hypothetical protein
MIRELQALADAVTAAGVPCQATPAPMRPSGLCAWLDAPTLLLSDHDTTLGGCPDTWDISVGLHVVAPGTDDTQVRTLYQALDTVLAAVPRRWTPAADATPEQHADAVGYVIPLTTWRR